MALDRQSIEKKDFPVGRRGYDPDAVDAHLAALADEIADFRRASRRRSDTLASSASDQVRAIVEAAENSAADIQRAAESEAREIRDEANSEAKATRDQAAEQAREYVDKVSESTNAMVQRLDAMETEFGELMESLRTGSNRLSSDLRLLETNLAEARDVITPRPQFEPEAEPAADAEPAEAEPELVAETEPELVAETEPEPVAESADGGEPVAVDGEGEIIEVAEEDTVITPASAPDDAEGARLIALNMALNGTPREETDRYLSENFQLSDRDGLLDEVYASVDG